MAMRLLPLLAINDGKNDIDREVVEKATAIAGWQLEVRMELDPIDADNAIAKMEEKIRRELRNKGARTERELRQYCGVKRAGIWIFQAAIRNLNGANEIKRHQNKKAWELVSEHEV